MCNFEVMSVKSNLHRIRVLGIWFLQQVNETFVIKYGVGIGNRLPGGRYKVRIAAGVIYFCSL